jgi:hypothetical protein
MDETVITIEHVRALQERIDAEKLMKLLEAPHGPEATARTDP